MFWHLYHLCPDPCKGDSLGLLVGYEIATGFYATSNHSTLWLQWMRNFICPLRMIPNFPHCIRLLDLRVALGFFFNLLFHTGDTSCFFCQRGYFETFLSRVWTRCDGLGSIPGWVPSSCPMAGLWSGVFTHRWHNNLPFLRSSFFYSLSFMFGNDRCKTYH